MNSLKRKPNNLKAVLGIVLFTLMALPSLSQNVTIPDANFKAALLADATINTVDDGEISVTEAAAYSGTLDVSSLSITDLTGIEAFTALTEFTSVSNSLTVADFTSNTALERLILTNTSLTSLDLSQNSSLIYANVNFNGSMTSYSFSSSIQAFYARNNIALTSVDISSMTSLQVLSFEGASLNAIDVSNNTSLVNLELNNNNLSSIDLSNNPSIKRLEVASNSFTSLDISGQNLIKIEAGWNDLTSIDFSGHTSLESARLQSNLIEVLNVSGNSLLEELYVQDNELEYLNVANGTNVTSLPWFNATGNTNLTCIQVDDVAYSSANWTDKDAEASYSLDCGIYFPDVNFKAALLAHDPVIDTNDDGEIQISEAEAVTGTLDVTNKSITDATGIEAFSNAIKIVFDSNNLGTIDVSANSSLETLWVRNCSLTDLDITSNTSLEVLYANNNLLTSVDLSQNAALNTFWCGNNVFSSIDLSDSPLLEYLWISTTSFTSIDISNNLGLISLILDDNALTSLDISNHTALTRLEVDGNALTSVDASNNPDLFYIRVQNNNLSSLDVRNGNNSNVSTNNFNATGNASLTCISVSDLGYANSTWTNIDEGASFSVGCDPNEIIDIPDANFKAYLVANGGIDTTDDDEITVGEATAYVGVIESASSSIADLTGIEYFTSLTGLNVSLNDLTTLNVSNNTALSYLLVGGNDLTSLDLSNNVDLFQLTITDCPISSIDLSANTQLAYFTAGNNGLTSIDISTNTAITNLSIYNQPDLAALDVSTLTSLKVLTAFNNAIASIDLSNNTLLEQALLENNQLTSIDVSDNIELFNLNVARNDLTTLDVTTNIDLVTLNFYQNEISTMDISNNLLIQNLIIQETEISSIDLSILPDLKDFRASNTLITDLDLSSNPDLTYFTMSGSSLESLDMRNGTNESITTINLASNTNLTCVSVDNAAYSKSNWTNIDDSELFKLSCDPDEIVNIPDANFKAALLANTSINTTDDGEITVGEAEAVVGILDISDQAIADLTGLEYFVNISELVAGDNDFATLDLSNNLNLTRITVPRVNNLDSFELGDNDQIEFIIITFSKLTALDLSSYGTLTYVSAPYNYQLTSVDFTGLTNLDNLSIPFGNLTAIDVSTNIGITNLRADGQDLSSIDVSNNLILTHLDISHNNLTVIDISTNDELISLRADSNPFASIDVSDKPNLVELNVSNTEISTLDISNNSKLKWIYTQDNTSLTEIDARNLNGVILQDFDMTGNTSLTCVQVDSPGYSKANWTDVDDLAVYKLSCNPDEIVNIPDANFKAALVADDLIDTDFDDEISVGEADAFIGTINVNEMEISDLTGIEYFSELTALYFNTNTVTSLDLSNNNKLVTVQGYNNSLTSFDISGATFLSSLNLSNSDLTTIDLSDLTNLSVLYLAGNNLTVDLSNNTKLTVLGIQNNGLTSLNIGNNVLLHSLYAQENELLSIDLSTNTALVNLFLGDNNLTSLDVSNNTLITDFRVMINQITELDLTANTVLEKVFVNDNLLTSLDVRNGNNTAITTFNITDNPEIACVLVDDVAFSSTNWTDIDATANFSTDCNVVDIPDDNFRNAVLANATINSNDDAFIQVTEAESYTGTLTLNGLAIADATGLEAFVNITGLNLDSNDLTSLDVTTNPDLQTLRFAVNGLTSIDLSNNTLLEDLYAGGNELSTIDLSDNTALVNLDIYSNNLTSIDFTNNTVLEFINLNSNDLTSLDVSTLVNLDNLTACCMGMPTVDLSNNVVLTEVWLQNNNMTEIDLSTCPLLNKVVIYSNDLTSVNLANGANENISDLRVQFNSTLGCITVDDPAYSESQNSWQKDETAGYSLDCSNVENSISVFSMTEETVTATIDIVTHTITVEVAFGTDITNLVPTFSISSGATVDPASDVAQNFTDPFEYTVTAENPGEVQIWTIIVTVENVDPTAIALDNTSIDENNAVDDVIGAFSTTDGNAGDTFTYTLVSGTGDTDNASFTISGNDLIAAEAFDFETKDSYSIRVETNDGNGGTFESEFTISINDVNENVAPTAIALNNSSIDENNAVDDVIGAFSTTDGNAGDTFTYTLVSGTGDTDNTSFTISGSDLVATQAFDFETKDSYSIRVETNDGNGGTLEAEFTITINDVDETIDQTITFDAISDKVFGAATFELIATASSELAVTFSVVSGSVTLDGNMVTITGAGEAVIAADQAGNDTFNAATQVTQSFAIAKADQTISITTIDDKLTTDGSFDVVASTTSELDLTYVVAGPASIDGTTITLDGTEGMVTVTVSQEGNDNYNAAEGSVSFEVIPTVTSVDEEMAMNVTVYPNPASEWITVQGIFQNEIQVQIIDLKGMIIIDRVLISGEKLSINEIKAGMYVMKISEETKTTTTRLIIRR